MKIVIPGKPFAKMRPRFSKRSQFVVTYDPQDSIKKTVRAVIAKEMANALNSTDKSLYLAAGEICRAQIFVVEFFFFLPVNVSDSVMIKNMKLWGMIEANCKPDYDNLEKFYLDCANGILWADDSMIIRGSARKRYDENPRVEIVVTAKKQMFLTEKAQNVMALFSPSEFKEIVNDAKNLAFLDTENFGEFEGDLLVDWLQTSACVLSKFALKHANKLTKVSKQGDVIAEVRDFEAFTEKLERGEYAI